MIDFFELWILIGILSAFYKYIDLTKGEKVDLEQLDYYVLFVWMVGGMISFCVVLYDICLKAWWDE